MLTSIKKYIHILRAKLRYFLFNASTIVVIDLSLDSVKVVAHPTKGYIDISSYLTELHEEQTEDTVYTLVSNNGIQYELKQTIKNYADQDDFVNNIFFNNGARLPKFIVAVRPADQSFFHKQIIRVGNI